MQVVKKYVFQTAIHYAAFTLFSLPFSAARILLFSSFEHEHQVKKRYNCNTFYAILSVPTLLLVCMFPRDKQLSALPKMPLHIIGLLTECIVVTYI